MTTSKQQLGDWGENLVAKTQACPKCKRTDSRTLRLLPTNFKCSDIICDFCGFLAQVKTTTIKSQGGFPSSVLGAAWKPQFERMQSGIYFSLYLVLTDKARSFSEIYYLPSELQSRELFVPRKPLSNTAKRAGWQGFLLNTKDHADLFVKLS